MKYTVVIPTYNHCDDLLKPCVESIIRNTTRTPAFEVNVVIVANGCTDGTNQYIAELSQRVLPFAIHSIHHDKPLGYTKATNLGIQKSIELESDYTILMNNDVTLMDFATNNKWLLILRKPFDENSKVGMCGTSKILDGVTGAEFIIFYMAMIRTELFKTVGLLDEQFNPGFGEDIDFAIRLQRAGYLLRRVPVEGVGHTYTETFPLIHGAEKTVHDEKSNLKTVFGLTWNEIIKRNEGILRNKYSNKKKYSIIIPTYNHCNDLLLPCLNSVLAHTKSFETEIIVVANGCTDNTREFIQHHQTDNLRLLWFDDPLGYTKAANEGIKIASGEYIVLLNNDTIILNDSWLRLLSEPFETELRLGITGVQLEYINGYQYLMFFCVMIKRAVFEEVGLLDEQFNPGGFEDADFCVRAASKGYRLTPVPPIDVKTTSPNNIVGENVNLPTTDGSMVRGQFPIFHTGGGTVTQINQWTEHMEAKRALFINKHGQADDPNLPDGWFNAKNIQQIRKFAEEMPDNGTMIQLGVWLGKSVCCLADIIKRKNLKIIAVDTFAGTLNDDAQTKEFMSTSEEYFDHNIRVCGLENYVTKMKMTTDEAAKLVEPQSAHVIFIDADHTYPFVVKDIRNWKPILKPNGIMCGHDYMLNDVYRAVHDSYRAEDIHIDNEIWWINPNRPKVYDTFMFFNEFDVLDIRLNELQHVVDYFVVVEGSKTHVGTPKPLWFKENKERFAEFLPQIRYVEVNDFPEYDIEKRYDLEAHQRAAMGRGLWDCSNHDIVLVSDVDEIPKAEVVLKYNPIDGICNIEQEMYYYYLNCTMTVDWAAAKIGTFADMSKFDSLQTIRNMAHPNSIQKGGWHFSFLGGKENIRMKVQSYVHIEYNNSAVLSDENIDAALNEGRDLFRRNLPLTFTQINDTYPQYVLNHLEYYKSIGFVKTDNMKNPSNIESDLLPEDLDDINRLLMGKTSVEEKTSLVEEYKRSRMDFWAKYMPNTIVNFIVATYNRHEELKRALDSIEKQTYNRIKVWVCADGADDKVKEIVEEFDRKSQYKQYNYRHLAEHEGLLGSKPRMLGIYNVSPIGATCFLDDDNIIYPDYTKKLFTALRSDGKYQGDEVYLPDSNVIAYCVITHSHAPHPIPLAGHVEGKFEYSNIDTLNIMVNSFVAKQCVNKWQHVKGQRITHDFDFIAECAKYGKSVFVNEILAEHLLSQNKTVQLPIDKDKLKALEPLVYDEMFNMNIYNVNEEEMHDAIVVDIGANYGFFSIRAAELGAKMVYAYEPEAANFQKLQELTSSLPQIKPVQAAVFDGSRPTVAISSRGIDSNIWDTTATQQVRATDLTEISKQFQPTDTKILLKLDCEGAEYNILYKTPPDILRKFMAIYIEIHDTVNPEYQNKRSELLDYLRSVGFDVVYEAPPLLQLDANHVIQQPMPMRSYKLIRRRAPKNKVYDGFLFFNEFDTLEIRLNELKDVVDKFVLVESNLTFTGKPKPYYFEENKQRFAQFADKILHVKLAQFNPTEPVNPWDMEHWQRNQIFEVFKECSDNDIVMLSDVDEIPSATVVKNFTASMGVVKIEQPMFYYYLNCKTTEPWYGTRIAPWGAVKGQAASYWRMVENIPAILKGGWHFSYLGGAENIVKKIDAFSHQEFNTPEINNVARITEKMNEGKDLFDRNMKFEFVPIDNSFPSYVTANYGAMAAKGLVKYGTGHIIHATDTVLPSRGTLKQLNGFVHDEIFEHDLYSMKKEEVENKIIVDIGAHYGYFGVRCLELGAESVHYYEPHPKNYEVLTRLMGQNPNVHLHNVAVTDGAFPKMFMRFDDVTADVFGQENDLAVDCVSLSAAVAAMPVSTNDMVLKLDCEGSEYEILLHAPADVLRKFERIYIEIHDDLNPNFKNQSKMLLGYLQHIGFKVVYQAPQFGNWYQDGSFVPFPVYTYKLERQFLPTPSLRPRKVYDCFMFNDELDVLDIRLEELNSVVDYFVIVESPVTHSGKPKPLYFAENKERYAKYLPKIRHYVFTDMPQTDNAWHRESHQRDACIQGLYDAQDYDIIISGDADEIPKRELIRGYDPKIGAVGVETKYYFYYLNCERQDKGTTHLRLLPYWLLKHYSFCFFRYKDYLIIPDGGWHFSFIGDVKQIKKKIESYAHQEYNTPYFTDEARLEKIINEGGDILEKGMQFKFVEINDAFPQYVINNKDYYIQHKNIKV